MRLVQLLLLAALATDAAAKSRRAAAEAKEAAKEPVKLDKQGVTIAEAAELVEEGAFKEAELMLQDVGKLRKTSPHRALYQTLVGQCALGFEPNKVSRRTEALAAFRQAVKFAPKDPENKLRLADLLLADVLGCPSGCPPGTADFAKEAAEVVGKVQRSGVTGLLKQKARLLTVRILRADQSDKGNAKKAEEQLTELTALADTEQDLSEEHMDFFMQCNLESGNLYMQYGM